MVDSSSVLVELGLQKEEGFTSWSGVPTRLLLHSDQCAGVLRTMGRNACADCGGCVRAR